MSSEHHKQESYAAAGYLTAVIDCHHHGERCAAQDFFGGASRGVYNDALIRWAAEPLAHEVIKVGCHFSTCSPDVGAFLL